MLKIEKVDIYGWESAIRGMRNPMNSWDKSDSVFYSKENQIAVETQIGPNDLELMIKLVNNGPEHAKFMRYINVTMDITAPMYWWSEYDTYKVGTVANSCSKMHKLTAKEFTLDDFSHEHLFGQSKDLMNTLIDLLNIYRVSYNDTKDMNYWWQIIQLLPASYNQKRTVQLNYQVLRNIYHQRNYHKLDEWHIFCEMIEKFPFSKELIIGGREG